MSDPTDPAIVPLPLDPLDELASAHLDGQTSHEEAMRIEHDPALQARIQQFADVRAAIRTTHVTIDVTRRDAMLAAAVAAADAPTTRPGPGGPIPSITAITAITAADDVADRRRGSTMRARWGLGVAAAAALVALALVPALRAMDDEPPDQVASSPTGAADEATAKAEAEAGAGDALATQMAPEMAPEMAPADGGAADDAPLPLGSFPDLTALTGAVRSALAPSPSAGTAPQNSTLAGPVTSADPAIMDCLVRARHDAEVDGGDVVLSRTATLGDAVVAVTVIHRVDRPLVLLVTDPGASCAVVLRADL